MDSPFLTANWNNLLMINFRADPALLKKYVPAGTELDTWNNTHYISLVGFLFRDTRVKGISFPLHRHFEEVNLRFYVRYNDGNTWKRGVVFIKELVPKRLITFVANTIYKENYATLPMRHHWHMPDAATLQVSYEWKVGSEWNYLRATAGRQAQHIQPGSEAEFITEHYWGYTQAGPAATAEYQVKHPQWKVHQVTGYDYYCNAHSLYGPGFAETLAQKPVSALLAEGSAIAVMPKRQLK
ncbi:YqjF family protein [Chitinophaga japonensis]|uniref:DUF2071 domain-containing protein n=1 Tax=Chitinophaga japonensis TaxID=104662 RepID=A0A562TFA6_CHIJA|nr:DUF2071 domain-containing protein [Chitinophaga japonensis]TWI92202.1 hypothetical protein LX66_1587 [Chitinophaga japonensis]